MEERKIYNIYSKYLVEKYGEKVYKVPVNIYSTCPNRDGTVASGGCIFCGDDGGSFESRPKHYTIEEQLDANLEKISKKYKAKKFIMFFQYFSNTYLYFEKFKENIEKVIREDVVEISISTRPDCINNIYLEYLKEIKDKYNIEITIELGLQTANYHTLEIINRGHSLAEFIDSMIRINNYNLNSCCHIILDLPWDNMLDIVETSKIISSLKVKEVKFHSLYVVKNTELEKMYLEENIKLLSKDKYIERISKFLEYLDPKIAVQRLIGRAPKEDTLIANWNNSWWKIKDEILEYMVDKNIYQGKKYNYLNGKALKEKGFILDK